MCRGEETRGEGGSTQGRVVHERLVLESEAAAEGTAPPPPPVITAMAPRSSAASIHADLKTPRNLVRLHSRPSALPACHSPAFGRASRSFVGNDGDPHSAEVPRAGAARLLANV